MKTLKMKTKKHIFYGMFLVTTIAIGSLSIKQMSKADWIEEENGIRYESEEGDSLKGFQEIEDKKYYFDKDGYLQKGKFFCEEDQQYYYADKKGVVQKDIIKTKNGFFIADENGVIQTGFVDFEGNRYFFNGAADMVTGWFKSEGNWYHADENGVVQSGFIAVDGYRYYLNEDGTRVSNAVMDIDGETYVFNEDGSIDENATTLYPVFQFFNSLHDKEEITMNSKVQACAVLRASELVNGYQIKENDVQTLEKLLKSRGIRCNGGYEFSYGGVSDYTVDDLMRDMKLDYNLAKALADSNVKEIGIGSYEEESILYFDIILICE